MFRCCSWKNTIAVALISACVVIGVLLFLRLPAFPSSEPQNGALSITASFYPLGFLAEQIAGDRATVRIITPAGAEPHEYEPTARDIAAIHDSDLLLLNGVNFEPWGAGIREALAGSPTRVLSLGDELARGDDPHIWLDVHRTEDMAMSIRDALIVLDPAGEMVYRTNMEHLAAALDELDEEYHRELTHCAQKSFVTSHAAFGYLAVAYRLEQISIAGLSPDQEPSPKQLAELAGLVKNRGIRVIFFEELVSPKLSETLARETGAEVLPLNPLEGLSDADIAAGKNYLTEMRTNMRHLRTALQCQ